MPVAVNTNGFDDTPVGLIEVAVVHTLGSDEADAEVSVTLVSDDEITKLNREYLGKDDTTDVIAFSLGDTAALLGDVYVCVDQARRQAKALHVSLGEELVRLAIHGALHVMGHDHPEGPERAECPMFVLQERLLSEVLAENA